MDCKTARLLLPLLNPRAQELPADLRQALESHVAECSSCNSLLAHTGRADRLIAAAMKDIEVPTGLDQRLLAGLRRERPAGRRTWPLRHPRAGRSLRRSCSFRSGERSVIGWRGLCPWLILHLWTRLVLWKERPNRLPTFSPSVASVRARRRNFAITSWFPPAGSYSKEKVVPRLLFQGNAGQIAEVYILTNKDFDLKASLPMSPAGSGNFTIELQCDDPNNPRVAYLVKYTGGPLDWLLNARPKG